MSLKRSRVEYESAADEGAGSSSTICQRETKNIKSDTEAISERTLRLMKKSNSNVNATPANVIVNGNSNSIANNNNNNKNNNVNNNNVKNNNSNNNNSNKKDVEMLVENIEFSDHFKNGKKGNCRVCSGNSTTVCQCPSCSHNLCSRCARRCNTCSDVFCRLCCITKDSHHHHHLDQCCSLAQCCDIHSYSDCDSDSDSDSDSDFDNCHEHC
ncbi:hypothetical protein SAMD00019534_062610 [Acytostelium subglobosum LB1]|uniref:hypothetical protein n=1 Tax=Acytostelium subglobosum LB1 TaxID=1410327 RepID=UPI000644F17F|nr:hypothetical protein SAMD00019534_062610 [Acytostelium subglobosum LB1]GAM23086.1 hypothetical protein SAMD00019534_062610 [Acytostelium subglobosum LB1]|eukprot:XP_012754313.1 hypothetical protein SAMD00019534_062610 [Acytostelium subglobosum LB1]